MRTKARGWWHYTGLDGRIVVGLFALAAVSFVLAPITDQHWMWAATAPAVGIDIGLLLVGAYRAERARRAGCW